MSLKYTLFLVVFLFPMIFLAQDNRNKQLEKAIKAKGKGEFVKAIEIYKKLVDNDKYNVDFQLGLAELYFLTNDVNKGCDCAYFAMIMDNDKAKNLLNLNCSDYKSKIKLLNDVDSPPMFLYEGEYQNLIENNEVNRNYLLLIQRELRNNGYNHISEGYGRVKIIVKVGVDGQFIGEIKGLVARFNESSKEKNEVKKFLEKTIFFKIKYKPAIFENEPVEIFEDFYLNM